MRTQVPTSDNRSLSSCQIGLDLLMANYASRKLEARVFRWVEWKHALLYLAKRGSLQWAICVG
jgi:hypothetical protein